MAYFDTKKGSLEEAIKAAVKNEKLDPVNKTAVKKKFDDRKDKDIDNDGDVDSTDKYLHKRRKAISKAIKSEDTDVNELSIADVKKATEKAKKRQEKERKATGRSGVSRTDMDARKEALDKDDVKTVKDVVKGLKKAVKTHQGQVKSLTKDIQDSYEFGTPEATRNSLNITPGQSVDDWDKQVGEHRVLGGLGLRGS